MLFLDRNGFTGHTHGVALSGVWIPGVMVLGPPRSLLGMALFWRGAVSLCLSDCGAVLGLGVGRSEKQHDGSMATPGPFN